MRRLDKSSTPSRHQGLLDGLEKAGWIKKDTTKTGGRAKHRWKINPKLLG